MGSLCIPVLDYYYDKVLTKVAAMPLAAQLKEIKDARILVLDYCGMMCKYTRMFLNLNTKVFLIENSKENPAHLFAGRDVVYVFSTEEQNVDVEFRHIRILFERNRIVKISYEEGNPLGGGSKSL